MFRSVRALAAALVLAWAGPAFAHAHLEASAPPLNGTVALAPPALTLDFSETLDLTFGGVAVSGPQGRVAKGPAALAPGEATRLVVPRPSVVAAGGATVSWHALSRDEHHTDGRHGCTVKP